MGHIKDAYRDVPLLCGRALRRCVKPQLGELESGFRIAATLCVVLEMAQQLEVKVLIRERVTIPDVYSQRKQLATKVEFVRLDVATVDPYG
jgi:hypothetical protein